MVRDAAAVFASLMRVADVADAEAGVGAETGAGAARAGADEGEEAEGEGEEYQGSERRLACTQRSRPQRGRGLRRAAGRLFAHEQGGRRRRQQGR